MPASPTSGDIAELCEAVEVILDPDPEGSAPDGADGPLIPIGEDGQLAPAWKKLNLIPIPGLDALIGTIKPPLEVIKALLQVIAAFAETLAAILMGLLDPYRALVLAAYQLLADLVKDITNSGGYLYVDVPPPPTPEQLGFPVDAKAQFIAGKTEGPAPPAPFDAWTVWTDRFVASFDDPGDDERPELSEGASVMAVFIVGAAPSFAALRALMYLLGKLFNIDAFLKAFDRSWDGPDPDQERAGVQPVAPDWKAKRLKDLIPEVEQLEAIPEALKALLLAGDNAAALLKDLAAAISDKAKTLTEMADAIQALIDLLDALSSLGLHVLPVMTTEGVGGLKTAFLAAENRPEGAYVGGVCVLAAGPSLAQATVLWNLLGQGGAFEQLALAYEQNVELAEQAAEDAGLEDAAVNLADTAVQAAEDIAAAVESLPQEIVDDLGEAALHPAAVIDAIVDESIAMAKEAAEVFGTDAIAAGEAAIEESRRSGPLALVVHEAVASEIEAEIHATNPPAEPPPDSGDDLFDEPLPFDEQPEAPPKEDLFSDPLFDDESSNNGEAKT